MTQARRQRLHAIEAIAPVAPTNASTARHFGMSSHWRRVAVLVFACVNVASVGVFFVVFIGVVVSPPSPRNLTYLLVAGSLAFAVLVMGQFVHWSRLALRVIKERRS